MNNVLLAAIIVQLYPVALSSTRSRDVACVSSPFRHDVAHFDTITLRPLVGACSAERIRARSVISIVP